MAYNYATVRSHNVQQASGTGLCRFKFSDSWIICSALIHKNRNAKHLYHNSYCNSILIFRDQYQIWLKLSSQNIVKPLRPKLQSTLSVQNLSRRFPNKSLHADDTAQSKTNCERDSIELRTGLRVEPIVDVE